MEHLTKQELTIIADNNNVSVESLTEERKQALKRDIKIYKGLCLVFIVLLLISYFIF